MDVLWTKSVAGVHKELAIFALMYNLVRLVMQRAAKRQEVPVEVQVGLANADQAAPLARPRGPAAQW